MHWCAVGWLQLKTHSEMRSVVTQHNATDAVSFGGVCYCHADCMLVYNVASELSVHFSTISHL